MSVNEGEYKFGLSTPVEDTVLTKDDILITIKYLVDLNNGKGRLMILIIWAIEE